MNRQDLVKLIGVHGKQIGLSEEVSESTWERSTRTEHTRMLLILKDLPPGTDLSQLRRHIANYRNG